MLRLFVAAELRDDARAACSRWRDEVVSSRPSLRPVPDESLHVTLSFLGPRPEEDVDGLVAALSGCEPRPPLGVVLGPPAWLPRRRPRVLALTFADPDGLLDALARSVRSAVGDPESRRFLAHVTVARVRAGMRIDADVLAPPPLLHFEVPSFALFRSLTDPGGARYSALWRS